MRSAHDPFPVLAERVFFNHAGVSPLPACAADALRGYADHASRHGYVGGDWYKRANEVKTLASRLIGARGPEEIAFIPNTSTGLALVARGLDWHEGDEVVTTGVEFPANKYMWRDLLRLGVKVVEVHPDDDHRIDARRVADAVTDRTRVVSVSHVQYSTGYRMDLKVVADMVHMAGGYLCVDGIQSVGALPVDVQAMGVDFLAADGHKWMLGPEGAGIFYSKWDLGPLLHPAVVGWMNFQHAHDYDRYDDALQMDARRFEPGCYNIPGILALGASLELLLDTGIDAVWSRIEALTQRLCDGLTQRGYVVDSPRENPAERSGIIAFSPPPGRPPLDQILAALERQKVTIVVRSGRLRASPHFYNTPEQVDRLVELLP